MRAWSLDAAFVRVISKSRTAWAAVHLLTFVLVAAAFYRIFPQFLSQNHDAQNVYFTVTKGFEWRDSIFEIYAYSPLSGLGTTFWPFSFPLIPYLAVFALTEDPTLRLYLLQVAAATTLFAGSLFFYLAIGIEKRNAVGASWMTFVVVMLYGLAYVSAPENLQVTIWLFVALGALARIGGGPVGADLAWVALFELSVIGFVLAVPAWHIVALPVFGICLLSLLWLSESRRQRAWRVGSVVLALAVQLALGTYQALRFTLTDTARVALRDVFAVNPHFQQIAGHLLNNQFIDLLIGTLFLIGLGWARARDSGSPPARALHAATIFTYAVLVAIGLYFYYTSGPWPLPWPKYLLMFAYPLTGLFAVKGVFVLLEARPDRARVIPVVVLLAVYYAWHVFNAPKAFREIAFVVALCGSVAVLTRLMPRTLGVLVIAGALIFGSLRNVDESFGGGADKRFDGALRAGLVRTPIIDYLVDRVALEPGKPFRGLVEDLYSRSLGSKELIDTIVGHWSGNWMKYGNGHKLFAWNVMDIPIAGEYGQYTKPLYFLLYTRMLNEPDDRQVFNYLSATRPNVRILQMLGVRYVVTDNTELALSGTRETFRWDKFRILEFDHPNLANYSPTTVIRAASARQALEIMSSQIYDPAASAIIGPGVAALDGLVPARSTELIFERAGYLVRASASGRSLIVLPIQFSHCFQSRVIAGDRQAKLTRVNIAMTGLVFDREVTLEARYRRWPLAGPECQRLDYLDSVRYRVGDVTR